MLAGHAFSRAVRAHILSFTAIAIIICKSMSNVAGVEEFINEFFSNWMKNPPLIKDCKSNNFMKHLSEEFIQKLNNIESKGPTPKLWIQYFKCVTIALQFIEAERLGDWNLHLQSIKDMLPLFYSSGHFAYAKSAQIYLQDMANLDVIMDPLEFERYTKDGYFTIRRSDKAWSGVWSDMIIEQTLNRFFGTDLKHGRGVTPSVVARYLFAMPSAFNVMECLENYCAMKSNNSEQHVDLSKSRMKRDNNDIYEFVTWLQNHNPFNHLHVLVSLSTGIIGGPNIDCHKAIEKGLQGMEDMVGKNADNISMSKIYKVNNLASAATGIHLDYNHEVSTIDIYLLFQRICVIFNGDAEKTREAFYYELTPYPLSLFNEKGQMRKTQKSKLYPLFKTSNRLLALQTSDIYVIDGGWLLHAVVWPHSQKFKEVFKLYLSYIIKHFGRRVTVVFDGYNNEYIGVKSYERYCRREKNVGADIDISEDKMVTMNQTKFLSNISNKLNFVDLLSKYLEENNIHTKISEEDADTVIIRTAIELKDSNESFVSVVGNDIDLLILLITHCIGGNKIYFYKMSPNKKNELYSSRDHKHLEKYILFAHAFAGCDSTSAIYNKGKKSIITLLEKNEDLQQLIFIFYKPFQNVDDIYRVAEKLMIIMYGADDQKLTLHELRYKIFCTSTAIAKKELSLSSLPPTDSVLREHAKRVYYQMQIWLGFDLDPVLWGWKRTSNMLLPIMNPKPVAPVELLEMIFCGCKTNCNTSRCSCKKAGIKCSYSCKKCNGQSCENASNSHKVILESDTEERQDDIDDIEDNENMWNDEINDLQEEDVDESQTEN
ncbi:uncharacterized protein LOC116417917 isoform X1 [Nasonia vitripennis]|uniref:Tesmin/TSO1-like CXC domain-containing protein n=2 Tax=Nasonia vitripennis TaxID=7425 RepID=A0A7M7TBC1_NASVI|nr:uncharacterized protein LOC116417917 isoform X1 [Nasonia vitripennis]